jgi:hypothetical protein
MSSNLLLEEGNKTQYTSFHIMSLYGRLCDFAFDEKQKSESRQKKKGCSRSAKSP